MAVQQVHDDVTDLVDRDKLIRWALELSSFYSPTGEERAVAEYLYEEYRKLGLRAKLQPISEERYNAIGLLEGSGNGLSLMFNGHLDVSHTGREESLPGGRHTFASTKPLPEGWPDKPPRVIDDHWLFGAQVRNMKGAIAAYLGAIDAILRSGRQLKGDIWIAGVAGEIEKAPVDDFRGQRYEGYGAGTKYMIGHGVTADMCILGEPSTLRVVPGHVGTVWLKLTTRGRLSHPGLARGGHSPILQMNKIITAIEEWIPAYQDAHMFNNVRPAVNIGAIQGGWPWRVSRTPVYCNLYLDVRTIPGQHPVDVLQEIQGLIRRLRERDTRLDVEVEMLVSDPATEIDTGELVCQTVCRSHEKVLGTKPEITYMGWASDAIHLNRYGIPTVIYGPGGKSWEGDPEGGLNYQNIDDLITSAKVYAVSAVDICSRDRNSRSHG